jgi:hypothetical protein
MASFRNPFGNTILSTQAFEEFRRGFLSSYNSILAVVAH